MKRTRFTQLVLVLFLTVSLFSCGGLEKMAEQPSPITWSVNPSPLEYKAEKVPVQINVRFPAKFFDKKAVLVTRPIIKWEGGEKELKPFTLQGESVSDNNKVISYDNGGSFTYADTVDYQDAMRTSTLEIFVKASAGDKSVDVPVGKLADGVITTAMLVKSGVKADNGDGYGQLIEQDVTLAEVAMNTYRADIHYALQQASLTYSERNADDVKQLIEDIKAAAGEDKELREVEIASYASPDGPFDLNDRLSKNRGNTAKGYIESQLRGVVDGYSNKIVTRETAEDWDGFKSELEKSNLRDKDLIKRVLSMYSDPVVREREIKNMSEAYTDLKSDVLPQLRRSKLNVRFETKARTDAQIAALAKSDPAQLSANELMHAALIADNTNDKIEVYETYTGKYPNDWKGFNNMGIAYLASGENSKAKDAFEKAMDLDENNGSIYNNLGVVALADGDEEKAYEYFVKAENAGENSEALNYNLGTLHIKKGMYNEAVRNFGTTNTFNTALAQLLNGDAQGAAATIVEVEKGNKDAVVYYLKAVIGARANDADLTITNLRTAVNKDSMWKEYAKDDLEFSKFFQNPDFKSIVN